MMRADLTMAFAEAVLMHLDLMNYDVVESLELYERHKPATAEVLLKALERAASEPHIECHSGDKYDE